MEQENSPLISVIVPVFNVERFLKDCIESVQNQSVHDLQIILIDDGSTDLSGKICDDFAKKDKRIQIIHQKNLGVSVARNVGLDMARGKYIAFVDSDDVLSVNAYSQLLRYSKAGVLVMGQTQLMSENGELYPSTDIAEQVVSQQEFLDDLFAEKKFPYLGYPVDKLFIREIIEKNHLRFDPRIKLNEDRLFVLNYLMYCETIKLINEKIYYYRQRSSGVIAKTRRNTTVTESEMTVISSFSEMQKVCKNYSMPLYYICSRKAFECALDLLNRVAIADKEKRKCINRFLWANSSICLKNPSYGIMEKLKIVGHSILKK